MNPENCRDRLSELLGLQRERVAAASDFLRAFKDAIAQNDLDAMQGRLQAPAFSIEDIEQIERQRHELLDEFGFGRDAAGMESCLEFCDADGRVERLYQSLTADLVELQREIQLNRLLVERGRERVRRSIGVLTGLGSGAQDKTYGSSGKAELPRGRRDIAIA